jgi:hypothetical protein
MKRFRLIGLVLVLTAFMNNTVQAQYVSRPDSISKMRLGITLGLSGGLYVSTMTMLYFLWYRDYPQSGFHWINDNSNWLQIDKIGHATTVSVASEYMFDALRWSGVENNKAAVYGALAGWGFMQTVEVFDGFSEEWGASWGDVLANTAGAGLFLSQQLIWKEQRFRMKFSYYPSDDYAPYRPDLLGENHAQRILKDYNSQTYWLSCNIHSWLKKSSKFPRWINVAVGYGGKGMLGAASNPSEYDGKPLPHYDRVRQYYISMDIDWTKIRTNSPFLRTFLKVISFVKIPFPALEYNKEDGVVWHWLFY